jgi:hypothetical protein
MSLDSGAGGRFISQFVSRTQIAAQIGSNPVACGQSLIVIAAVAA